MFETLAGGDLNAIDNPAGTQVQDGGGKREIDELHVCDDYRSGAHFSYAGLVRNQQNVSTTVREDANCQNTRNLVQSRFHL